ncbi:phytoene desaturase family protein [Nocardioides taihuensis]|uniref:Pyridine nucleotide-disulfide oxidoreductase domain-containing protein 2 n=1 Tax=Nocardioides taihuensis TaxID=1835606 RepID=A0ABW0BQ88_9ACTN
MSPARTTYDVVVAGGGHNGLVAATYLSRAGLAVLVLERLDHLGGAAVAAPSFPGHAARVSRHAQLASIPASVVADLGLDLDLLPRPEPAYPPLSPPSASYDAWREVWADAVDLAHVVEATVLEPLPLEREVRERLDPGLWRDFVTTPLATTLEQRIDDDLTRGLVGATALAGASFSLAEPSLRGNRSFLHHALGLARGGWRVPRGGMGAVTAALAASASDAGVEVVTGAGVSAVRGSDDAAEVTWHDGEQFHTVATRWVLADVAPWVLRILLGEGDDPETKPEGAQVKVDLLLDRLPDLASGDDPAAAFAGTLRLDSGLDAIEAAAAAAAAGEVPDAPPLEVHCPTLVDRSPLGAHAPDGQHLLSLLVQHVPVSLFTTDVVARQGLVVERALATLDRHLTAPLESCVARDADGQPCIEARLPHDVEAELGMPGGHPFHGDLDWPWAPNRALLDTPARQWGVASDVGSVLVCGAGARRGGGVTGIAGHNAAQAVLAAH